MKVCQLCGETYKDFIDFCFIDGEVLEGEASPLDVPEPVSLPPRSARRVQRQGSQVPRTRTATPTPRLRRRSLLGHRSSSRGASGYTSPTTANKDAPQSEPVEPAPAAAAAQGPGDLLGPPGPLPQGDQRHEDPDQGVEQEATESEAEADTGGEAEVEVPPDRADTAPIPRPTEAEHAVEASSPPPMPVRATPDELGRALAALRRDDRDERLVAIALLGVAGLMLIVGGALVLIGVSVMQSQPVVVDAGGAVAAPPSLQEATDPDGANAAVAPPPPASEPEAAGLDEEDPAEADPDAPGDDEPGDEVDGAAPKPPVAADDVRKPTPQRPVRPRAPAASPAWGAEPGIAPKPKPAAAAPTQVATSTVRVRSSPSGATVNIDGRKYGVTPLKVELPRGRHALELVLDGHRPHTQTLTVTRQDSTLPAISLSPIVEEGAGADQAAVAVTVFYAGRVGHKLYVDGDLQGQLPVTASLPAGVHTFRVSGDGMEDFQVAREVKRPPGGGKAIIKLDDG